MGLDGGKRKRSKYVNTWNLIRDSLAKNWNKWKIYIVAELSPIASFYYHPSFKTEAQVILVIGERKMYGYYMIFVMVKELNH